MASDRDVELRGDSRRVFASGLNGRLLGSGAVRGLSIKAVDVSRFEVLKRDTDI